MNIETLRHVTDLDSYDDLTAAITVSPQHVRLSDINQQTGNLTYTPQTGYVGLDRFSFKVNDGKADSNNDAVVMITLR